MKPINKGVTKELVTKVKALGTNPKYKDLTQDEIGLLSGTSGTTVSRILSGKYDHLFEVEKPKETNEVKGADVSTSIPYAEFKELIGCEEVIDNILMNATLSNKNDGLFIPSGKMFAILKAYVPHKVEETIERLRKEGEL